MKNCFQNLIVLFLFVSCTKSDEIFTGKNIDNEILGEWNKQYSVRDQNNGITLYSDTIFFNHDNSGIWIRYKFNEVDNSDPFSFYTEENTLHLRFEKTGVQNNWEYKIQLDTLIINKSNFKR